MWKFWVVMSQLNNNALILCSHHTDLKDAEKRFDVLKVKKLKDVIGYELYEIRQNHKPLLIKSYAIPS